MLNFQEMIARLLQFWADQGCVVHQGYDLEVGAGTFNPATFLRCLGPEPYSAVYVEPSRRPQDGRYGENPNRVQFYHQMQVIIKPSPLNIQDLYLQSLEAIGLNLIEHDIRFVHDDWENPTIGAWGLGWEIWADGMEVSQFTYFQAVGGLPVNPVSGEITYGLERLAMYIQGVDSMFDLQWNDEITYGDIYKRSEFEWSHYNFTEANTAMWLRHFEDFEQEAKKLIHAHFPIPAYDFVMKSSHAFNILDARGVISVTERTAYIGRIRHLAKLLADEWIENRERLQFPLLRNQKTLKKASAPPVSEKFDPEERLDFLLEIGSEELPATFVPIGMQHLENHIKKLLQENELSFEKIETFATPRRLALRIEKLAGGTFSKKIERKGPPVATAFQANGDPTQAGEGFFRSLQLESCSLQLIESGKIAGLEIRKIKEVPYLFANLEQKGISTRQLLAQNLPKMILGLDFPKKMRWSDLEIEYARPLKWIVALYGDEIVPFVVGNLTSSNISYGHRQLSPEAIPLENPKEYLERLRKHWVIADVEERKDSIEKQIREIEEEYRAKILAKERVLPQVLHLVEYPFLTVGNFDPKFLQSPQEISISEMVEHQKYFPLANLAGDLIPHFVIVCNNEPTDLIRKGNQKALSPRLADGMFLYEEDLQVPLEEFNEKLKTVTFQKELGSMWEKVKRLIDLAAMLHVHLPIGNLDLLSRAAKLCKADLASHLVGEFPELQGVIGKLYALKQGENQAVASAIEEHWMPRGEKAPLPQTPCGTLLSIAEKIDNFLSCFALNLKPTSSSDPYALRRQAIGLLKMLVESHHSLPLREVFKEAFEIFLKNPALSQNLKEKIEKSKIDTLNDIMSYFVNRYRTLLIEYDFEKDEIESLLNHEMNDPYTTFCKLKALHHFRKTHHAEFLAILEVYTRTKKILSSQNALSEIHSTVDPLLFKDPSELSLYTVIANIKMKFSTDLVHPGIDQWNAAFAELVKLHTPVNQLFENVKIIEDALPVRNNRLALLNEVWHLCEQLADLSKIQEHALHA